MMQPQISRPPDDVRDPGGTALPVVGPTPRVGLERGIRSGGKGVNISQTCPDALKIEEVPRAALYDYQLQEADREASTSSVSAVFVHMTMVIRRSIMNWRKVDLVRARSAGRVYKAVAEPTILGRVICESPLLCSPGDQRCCGERRIDGGNDDAGDRGIVSLWVFFQAKEERLLVYDYQPNGSLYSLIHEIQEKQKLELQI
ncbi:hypothetical protein E2562_000005 [Oryza meyeriana var. granulata]|uniref:Uncharacterized protein n=1 Tax=Oryza meyeriana var. granulata TaxID=110450 RepID=A0A6G1DB15_9ORYZ|nr:hypothetical protein E2562_000005 [Oryza meyeriana var. granulata]KAF0909637.1 hypothetical protein E2562_000005 [Oryza meyeriana var. granulata]KAF0909638.1 hypothetical protein E2562_000005 [Oryza meyeriana var. granulata]